jgi:5-methylcytosine-specific restriction endonuclease McrA
MPIRSENKARYPKDWSAISLRIRQERAANRCECEGECGDEHCGRCPALNGEPHPLTLSRVVLTVAHLDHQPENCADDNLKAMCQRCHNRYDMPMRRAGITQRARAKMAAGDLFE